MLARPLPAVVQIPEFRALVLRVPLAELVAVAEDALLGTGLLLIAAGTADGAIDFVRFNGIQQRVVCSLLRLA